jgi:hypothetical protein
MICAPGRRLKPFTFTAYSPQNDRSTVCSFVAVISHGSADRPSVTMKRISKGSHAPGPVPPQCIHRQHSTVIHSRQCTGGKHNAYNDALTPFQTGGDEADERRGIGCTVEPGFIQEGNYRS